MLPDVDSAGIAQAGTGERLFWVLIVARAVESGGEAPIR